MSPTNNKQLQLLAAQDGADLVDGDRARHKAMADHLANFNIDEKAASAPVRTMSAGEVSFIYMFILPLRKGSY